MNVIQEFSKKMRFVGFKTLDQKINSCLDYPSALPKVLGNFFACSQLFLVPHLYGGGTLVLGQDFTIKNTTLSLMNPLRSGA